MKILSDRKYNELLRTHAAYNRMSEAYRWLSEWDSWLKPMWDYLFHKEESLPLPNGGEVRTVPGGDINQQRERMRDAVRKQRLFMSFDLQAKAFELCADEIDEKFGEPKLAEHFRQRAQDVRKKGCEVMGRHYD